MLDEEFLYGFLRMDFHVKYVFLEFVSIVNECLWVSWTFNNIILWNVDWYAFKIYIYIYIYIYIFSMCIDGSVFLTFYCVYNKGIPSLGFDQQAWLWYEK